MGSAREGADVVGGTHEARLRSGMDEVRALELPTVALFLAGHGLFWGSCAMSRTWPLALSVLLNAIAIFVLFTVSHDCIHDAVSTNKRVTRLLGRLSTMMFAPHAGMPAWRYIHLQHHRFTNARDGRDPDMWTHSGPRWQLPLRWATIDLFYLFFYLPRLRTRPASERAELWMTWLAAVSIGVALVAQGYGLDVLVLYLVPHRLAIAFLAWSFDYLPHHGLEEHTFASDRYKATRNFIGGEKILGYLLLGQNYHLVHHLHPRAPFYRYAHLWLREEEAYLAREPALSDLRGRPLTPAEYRARRGLVRASSAQM